MRPSLRSRARRHLAALGVVFTALVLATPTAGAQYGGGANLFIDPVLIEICETGDPPTFDAFGNAFPPSSTVTLTVDGIAGTLGSTTTNGAGIFSFDDIVVPPELTVGNNYTIRASAGGDTATAVMTVAADTSEECGGTVASSTTTLPGGSTSSTTTTTDPGGSTTTAPGSGGIDGSTGGPSGGNDGLAITGLTRLELSVQIGLTLVGAGAVLVLVGRRRRDATA